MSSAPKSAWCPPFCRWQSPSKWAAEGSQLAVLLAEALGLRPSFSRRLLASGLPLLPPLTPQNKTGRLMEGYLIPLPASPEHSWEWACRVLWGPGCGHIGFSRSDLFTQMVAFSSKIPQSSGQENGGRKGCPSYIEVSLLRTAEKLRFPLSQGHDQHHPLVGPRCARLD